MSDGLERRIIEQNHRCDECRHGQIFPVPTLVIFYRDEITPSGLEKIHRRQRMIHPRRDVFCPILQDRVRPDGQCDVFKW